MHFPIRFNSMTDPQRYFCDCSAFCRRPGRPQKQLAYSTWLQHATHRAADAAAARESRSTPQAQASRGNDGPQQQTPAPLLSASKRPRAETATSGSAPQREFRGSAVHVCTQAHSRAQTDAGTQDEMSIPTGSHDSLFGAHSETTGGGISGADTTPEPTGATSSASDVVMRSVSPVDATRHAAEVADPGSLAAQSIDDDIVIEPASDDDHIEESSSIEDVNIVLQFTELLRNANIENGDLSKDGVHRLLHPPQSRAVLSEVEDRGLLLSLRLFLAHQNSPEQAYADTARVLEHAYPAQEPSNELLSLHRVKEYLRDLTGVSPIVHDMCPNSCAAYTGPWQSLDACPVCKAPRYDPRTGKPRQHFSTMPIAPVIQAMRRDPTTSARFEYGSARLRELVAEAAANGGHPRVYNDVLCGSDFIEAFRSGRIKPTDILLMVSYDGCQIYRDKQSDCWIYIWIFLSIAPDFRYKLLAVQPGGFIPGPNKPKNFESFIFPGLHHVAAVNKLPGGGLPVWQAHSQSLVHQRLFIALAGADGPAMASWNGLVGHSGRLGCRYLCMMKGRRKPKSGGGGHNYPCMLLPTGNYAEAGCDHPDYVVTELPSAYSEHFEDNLQSVISSPHNAEYLRRRAATGISKPSILRGLGDCILGVPRMCGGDIMHLVLNLGELLIPLWRGTFERAASDPKETWYWAVLTGPTWEQHGRDVANATAYLPSSFGRAPRNPAEKINSGYKQWEYLLYLFGLCPGLLYKVLPDKLWQSFCKLARGIRLTYQYSTPQDQVDLMKKLLLEFMLEFETMYYRRQPDRIHFVRQSIHVLHHIAPELQRIGPGICSSQFPIERTIGNLTQELRLHSSPYANLSQRGLLRCMLNSARAMIPELDLPNSAQRSTAINVGNGYALLPKRDTSPHPIGDISERSALYVYLQAYGFDMRGNFNPKLVRWARLRLPNGQIARSQLKENGKSLQNLRVTRNVKVRSLTPTQLL